MFTELFYKPLFHSKNCSQSHKDAKFYKKLKKKKNLKRKDLATRRLCEIKKISNRLNKTHHKVPESKRDKRNWNSKADHHTA